MVSVTNHFPSFNAYDMHYLKKGMTQIKDPLLLKKYQNIVKL